MAQEDTKLILAISADIAQLRRAMQSANDNVAKTTKDIEKSFGGIGPAVDRTAQHIGQSMERAGRQAQQATRNIGFQLQDITQGLLSGTSPFTIMAQQTAQVSQAMDDLGQKTGRLRALGAAFASMFSLQTLGIGAVILAFGYLTQAAVKYFSTVEEGTDEATKNFREHLDTVGKVIDEYGDLEPVARNILKAWVAEERLTKATEELGRSVAALKTESITRLEEQFSNVSKVTNEAKRAIDEAFGRGQRGGLFEELALDYQNVIDIIQRGGDATGTVKALIATLRELERQAPGADFGEWADVLEKGVLPNIEKLVDRSKALDAMHDAMGKMKDETVDFKEVLETFTDTTLPQLVEGLNEWLSTTDKLLQSYGVDLPGALSRLGDIATAGFSDFKASAGDALDLIADFEDFREKAYPDIRESTGKFDAWRVGFGSDTYVDEMNQVRRVTEDTVVTLTQAKADLSRRVAEFQGMIIRDIGPDVWRSLDKQQQAALTSLTYNFGHFPDSVARAIKQGDRGQVADAIAGLSRPGQINYKRRQREAAIFAGGEWTPRKDVTESTREENIALQDQLRIRGEINAGIDQTVAKQQAALKYAELRREAERQAAETGRTVTAEELAAIQKTADEYGRLEGAKAAARQAEGLEGRLQGLRDENALLAQQVAQLGASTVAIDQNRVAQEAANEALKIEQQLRAQGVTLTAAQSQAILQQTTAIATARAQIDGYNQSQKQMTAEQQRFVQQVTQTAQSAFSGFVNDLRNGVTAADAFTNSLDRIIDGLINMAIEAMFAKDALGGVFARMFGGGGTFAAATAHEGGIVGQIGNRRQVSPLAFVGAPRYQRGGIVGLKPGEVPIIAHRGEVVLPSTKSMARGNATVDNSKTYFGDVTVNVPSGVVATSEQGRAVGLQINKAVQNILVAESRPGGLLRRIA